MSRLILLFSFCLGLPAYAADIKIDMLNKQGRDRMDISQKIAKVADGDTVQWKTISKGHNVEFIIKIGVPGLDPQPGKQACGERIGPCDVP